MGIIDGPQARLAALQAQVDEWQRGQDIETSIRAGATREEAEFAYGADRDWFQNAFGPSIPGEEYARDDDGNEWDLALADDQDEDQA